MSLERLSIENLNVALGCVKINFERKDAFAHLGRTAKALCKISAFFGMKNDVAKVPFS